MSTKKSHIIEKNLKEIGNRMRSLRKLVAPNQAIFAKSLGISANFVSDLERGITGPSMTLLLLIELRYAITPEQILTGKGFCLNKVIHQPFNDKGPAKPSIKELPAPYKLDNQINDLLSATRKILTSGNQFAINALSWNIRYFSYTIDLENRIKTLEQRFEIFEKDRVESNNL